MFHCMCLKSVPGALLLISGVWAWAIMSIKTARPATIKEQTVKVSQFLRACKEQTVILWTSAIGNFNIIRRQRACKEQKTIQGISAISNLYRYVDMLEHCSCLSCAELCVCVCNCVFILRAEAGAGHSQQSVRATKNANVLHNTQ